MNQPRQKRKFRIRLWSMRLRTVLILVTVFCLWCGWYVHRAKQQRLATEWIKSMRGNLTYRHHVPQGATWLNKLFEIDYLATVESVSFQNIRLTDIDNLRSLNGLKTLELKNNRLEDISAIKELTRLERLTIVSNPVQDIRPIIHHAHLSELDLSYTLVADVEVLVNLHKLTNLKLGDTLISQSDFERLRAALPDCEIFWAKVRANADGMFRDSIPLN